MLFHSAERPIRIGTGTINALCSKPVGISNWVTYQLIGRALHEPSVNAATFRTGELLLFHCTTHICVSGMNALVTIVCVSVLQSVPL